MCYVPNLVKPVNNSEMKMKFFPLGAVAILMLVQSCTAIKPLKNDNYYTSKADSSMNSPDWSGTYTGILPCADCEGIQTTMKINRDLTYSIETRYLGKSNEIRKAEGTFSFDRSGNTISLDNTEDKTSPSFYAVGENKLTQLDLKGKIITGSLSDKYILIRQTSPIVEKYWKLVELDGKAVVPPADENKEAHMILKAMDKRLTGNGGCNSYGGTYELPGGNHITFSRIISTRMACPDMQDEDKLFEAFGLTDNYTMKDGTLILNSADAAPLARFEEKIIK